MTQDEIQQAILTFLRTNIVYDQHRVIGEDESFLEAGILDSTGILELIGFLEGEYGVKFLDEELVADNFDTLRRISGFMWKKLAKTRPM